MANMQVLASPLISAVSWFPFTVSKNRPSLNSDVVGNYWTDSPLSMLPVYHELISAGLRIWVFRYEKTEYQDHDLNL